MPKKRLIFHFGLPRTGTTSIQTFLRVNETLLEKRGVLYPRIDPEPYLLPNEGSTFWSETTLHVLRKAGNQAVFGFAAANQSSRGRQTQIKLSRKVWSDFLKEFRASKYSTAILSYESFGGNPGNFDLSEFREEISELNVVGIVYLRRFDEWIKSLFDQAIRGPTRVGDDFTDFSYYRTAKHHTFVEKLDALRDRFYLNDLIVRSFDEASKSNRLLEDFLSSLGMLDEQIREAINAHSRKNASLSPSQTLVLQLLNRWGVSNDDFVAVRTALLRSSTAKWRPDPYSIAPAEALAHLRSVSASDAAIVLQRYGIDTSGPNENERGSALPHRLTKARFHEVIRSISRKLSPDLLNRLDNNSLQIDN